MTLINSEDAYDALAWIIKHEYEARGKKWPDAKDGVLWLQTELAEVAELILAKDRSYVRNHPEDHPAFSKELLAEELGDVIWMALVIGIVEGVDPITAMVDKAWSKIGGKRE